MARENCTLYRDKFITDCNENCYGCCNRLYSKYKQLVDYCTHDIESLLSEYRNLQKNTSDKVKEFKEVEALVNQGHLPQLKENN